MKNLKTTRKAVAMLMVLLFTVISFAPAAYAFDDSCLSEGFRLVSESRYKLVGGVTEKNYVINDEADATQIKSYAMEIDLSDPTVSIISGYNDGDTDEWTRETVMNQALAMQESRGVHVVGAINADFYSHMNGKPTGPLVMNGVDCNPGCYEPYFAILKDGTPVIRDANVSLDDVAEAVGGSAIIIRNGRITTNDMNSREPRTAVGLKADGTVVFFVADGRQAPASIGMYIKEVAESMLAMGCVIALNLDGGGSTTFVTQREGTDSLAVNNSPCYLTDREVSSTLMVCTTAEPIGEFDHVAFGESRYECFPMSSVRISYSGIDANGYAVKLPSNGKVVLSDDSCGRLIGKTFFASKNEGDVTISYEVDGVSYGSAELNVSLNNPPASAVVLGNFLQKISTFIQFCKYAFNRIFNGGPIT